MVVQGVIMSTVSSSIASEMKRLPFNFLTQMRRFVDVGAKITNMREVQRSLTLDLEDFEKFH